MKFVIVINTTTIILFLSITMTGFICFNLSISIHAHENQYLHYYHLFVLLVLSERRKYSNVSFDKICDRISSHKIDSSRFGFIER